MLVYRAFGGSADPRVYRGSVILVVCAAAFIAGLGAASRRPSAPATGMAALVIVAGLALIVGGLLGGARWLIVPALMMALPVSVVPAADIDLKGGVGERDYRPGSMDDLRRTYRSAPASWDRPARRRLLPRAPRSRSTCGSASAASS